MSIYDLGMHSPCSNFALLLENVRLAAANRAGEGFDRAFAELVSAFGVRLVEIAKRCSWGGNVEDAEDLAQTTLFEMRHLIGTFAGETEDQFCALFRRVALNNARDVGRKKRAQRRLGSKNMFALNGGSRNDVPVQRPSARPSHQLNLRARAELLRASLETLRPDCQQVLRLYYFEGKSIAEIADLLELPQNSVRMKIFRATRALKKRLPGASKLFSKRSV